MREKYENIIDDIKAEMYILDAGLTEQSGAVPDNKNGQYHTCIYNFGYLIVGAYSTSFNPTIQLSNKVLI